MAHQAGVAFGWFAFFTYCVDGGFAVREYLTARQSRGQATTTAVTTVTSSENRY